MYVQSDIHGCLNVLKSNMNKIDMTGDCQLIFLGDYIDYGTRSCETLRYLYDLQKEYGSERVIVLKGNHEKDFLEWLDEYSDINRHIAGLDNYSNHEWLQSDMDADFVAFESFVTSKQMEYFEWTSQVCTMNALNCIAVKMIMENHGDLVQWLRGLPYFYETEKQVFVHAGIVEWAGENWECLTPEEVMVGKYPPAIGEFCKDIIAGHVSTDKIAGDKNFHKVFYDGKSHYYLDGAVYISEKIPVLIYDTETGKYEY